jgi:hypothetical protein
MLFSPTIGAAITAGYWFLWARCPACRTTGEDARLAPQRGRDGPNPGAVVPILSAERAVRRTRLLRSAAAIGGSMNKEGGTWIGYTPLRSPRHPY